MHDIPDEIIDPNDPASRENETKRNVEDLGSSYSDLDLMASTDIGIVFVDRHLRIGQFTSIARRLCNFLESDLGRPLSDIADRLCYAEFHADAEAVLRDGKALEREIQAEDGKSFLMRMAPHRTEEQRNAGVVATFIEITRRKAAEEDLRQSRETFAQDLRKMREEFERQSRIFDVTLSNIIDFAYVFDREGRFVFANKALLDLWGLKLEEAVGKNFNELNYEPELAAKLRQQIEHVFQTGEVVRDETPYTNSQGNGGFYEYIFSPLRGPDGEVQAVVGSTHVITERKAVELALRESEERYRLMVDGARDYAIFMVNPSNEIVYWSAGAERVFGWSAEEAIGESGELIFTPEDRGRKAEEKEIELALRDGTAPDKRWHMRKDGTRLWIDGVMRRLNDNKTGALRGFAKIARDATEARRAEQELRIAHEELEQRVQNRTAELQAMNDTLEAEMERRQSLEREILQVTERERARISQDLHDGLCQELTATAFSLKSRAKAIKPESAKAGQALEEAAQTVNNNVGTARDLARGIHPFELGAGGLVSALRELCSRTTERVNCRCDTPRMMRLSENLTVNLYRIAQEAVTNIIKHAKAGDIRIKLTRDGKEIVLSVSDNGKKAGTIRPGMGVHMMHYRAHAIGGQLEISSKRGKGTKVTCRVPATS